MNALGHKLVEMGLLEEEPQWFDVFLGHLKAFQAEQGHCKVPKAWVCPDGYNLGGRVASWRYHKDRLTAEQCADLDALGFIWDGNEWFPEFLQHLKAFKAGHGHCRVPDGLEYPKGYKLGQKVGDLRYGNYPISESKRAELDALGFIWNASLIGAWWPEFIQHLRAFKEEHGHCKVPQSLEYPSGYKLGSITGRVRTGNNRLTSEQRAELDTLSFVWNGNDWYPVFIMHLKEYQEEHGHCRVLKSWVCPEGYKLGQQAAHVRSGKVKFTNEQRAELDYLGFVWDASFYGAWYPKFLAHLNEYKAEHGHCRVPHSLEYPLGYKLGWTVGGIRSGNNKITDEQRAELDDLGFIWRAR